ncbi:hypothetical protein BU15DRAFT_88645 [Melanogaster broomeanus]|nr:hypothetical protein BU15DRAFT_88645 [Melanogaster broomeanus]
MNSPSKAGTLWKGKGKAIPQDYDDLRPTITYRHLYSHNLGTKDPLRVIALCDSDAFYAACERVRLGLDPSVPLVVQQWGSLIAVSYPARKFGISRMDKIKDARKKCPDLVAVHVATYKEGEKEPGYWDNVDTQTHKVSLDLYRHESNKIINLFKGALPNGQIEKASIDEAFIDFTRPVRERLLDRFPYLAQVPADAPQGVDSPLPPAPPINWSQLGALIPVAPAEGNNEDELPVFEDDHLTTWHDVALSIAAELMGSIREDVHKNLGYTMSAGIARNKFLAKLSASYKKPNSQSILRNDAIPNYLRPMGFQKVSLADALAKEYDVSTVGDLLDLNQELNITINDFLDEMQDKFGENALWVYELLRGIDRSEVKEKSALFKSMLASKNLPQPITKPDDGHQWIRLSDSMRHGEEMPTLWPKTIVLHARQGYETSRSKQSAFPFTREVTVDVIAAAADKLWKELTGNAKSINVTCVQLAFTGIGTAEIGQQNLEGFFKLKESQRSAVKRPRSDSDNDRDEDGRSQTTSTAPQSTSSTSFVCERCRKRIALREDQLSHSEEDGAVVLDKLRAEHDDFHFAQDLANGSDSSVPLKPKRSQSRRRGLRKFFSKK